MVTSGNIHSFTESELQSWIEKYPYFALARKEYFTRLAVLGKSDMRSTASKVGLHVPSRKMLFIAATSPQPIQAPLATISQSEEKPKVVVVGGDYFSKEDFDDLIESGQGYDNINFSPYGSALAAAQAENFTPPSARNEGYIDIICTETLAEIYIEQGFVSKAIEVYEKLILLYPEKNTYFASLIEKIKIKNN